MLDMERNAAMVDEGLAREVVNLVQKLRKKGQLVPTDPITVFYKIDPTDSDLASVISCHDAYIESSLRVPIRPASSRSPSAVSLVSENCQVRTGAGEINLTTWKYTRR